MAHKRPVLSVKPVCAVTFAQKIDMSEVLAELSSVLGRVESSSPVFAFDYTNYYLDEMGGGLVKQFFAFEAAMKPDKLPAIKTATNQLEKTWAESGSRKVNLDPGYITGAKLVLASAKDYSHRIYLAEGIYGDVQLRYQHGSFTASEWTYPDYQSALALTFFETVRNNYIKQERVK